MTLLPALQTFLQGLGITGAFPQGQVADGNTEEYTLLQHAGSHDYDTTRGHKFPVVQITFRRKSQGASHAAAWAAYHALNTLRPLTLTSGCRATRSQCPEEPLALGRDGKNLWGYTLDVNFTFAYSAAI